MFITIEGIDGCGKTSQSALLNETFAQAGRETLWTREPGDWSSGQEIRNILLRGTIRHPLTETLLFLADRCEHVRQKILPALEQGKVVICERYNDSTRAYQCCGRGLDPDRLETLIRWAELPEPDVTIFLEISPSEALRRRLARSTSDRIEAEMLQFHQRIADGFKKLAEMYVDRIITVDASDTPQNVHKNIVERLAAHGVL